MQLGAMCVIPALMAMAFGLDLNWILSRAGGSDRDAADLSSLRCAAFAKLCKSTINTHNNRNLLPLRCLIFDAVNAVSDEIFIFFKLSVVYKAFPACLLLFGNQVLQNFWLKFDTPSDLGSEMCDAIEILCGALQFVVDGILCGEKPMTLSIDNNCADSNVAAAYSEFYRSILAKMGRKVPSIKDNIPIPTDVSLMPFTTNEDVYLVNPLLWIATKLCSTEASPNTPTDIFIPGWFDFDGVPFPGHHLKTPPVTVFPCPSLHLAKRFLHHFTATKGDVKNQETASIPAYQRVAEAFVASSAGDMNLLSLLPSALRDLIALSLLQCRENPPSDWPSDVLTKIGRNDLCAHLTTGASGSGGSCSGGTSHYRDEAFHHSRHQGTVVGFTSSSTASGVGSTAAASDGDGLLEVEREASKYRFADDDRVHEVKLPWSLLFQSTSRWPNACIINCRF
jgi:hypothetical protein